MEENKSERSGSINEIILLGNWLIPRRLFDRPKEIPGKKRGLISLILYLFLTATLALALLGTADGPFSVKAILTMNYWAYSQFLKGYVIYSFLFLWLITAALTYIMPLLMTLLFFYTVKSVRIEVERGIDNAAERNGAGLLASYIQYTMLGPLTLMILPVAAVFLLNFNKMEFYHLNPPEYFAVLYLILLIILIWAFINYPYSLRKLFGISTKIGWVQSIIMFIITAAVVIIILT